MPTDLINPYSALSVPHRCSKLGAFFFKLSDPRLRRLERWTQDGKLQPEVANKVKEWFSVRTNRDGSIRRPGRLGHQPDAPYFGLKFPDAPGRYFCGWTRVGYLASLKTCSTSAVRTTPPTWPTRHWSSTTSSARTS
jgi:methionyl-tRNA synthetase